MTSRRRIGGRESQTRAKLLDAAEQMMLEEGYAAVTSRRVGRKAGIAPQLVHYYFHTMDDLFLEVFRRRAEEGFARFERAIAAEPTLRTIWRSLTDGAGAVFNLEFVALANHRKPIRTAIASYAERFRTMQLEAIASILAHDDTALGTVPAEVVLMAMVGVAQVVALERALGVSGGHATTLDFVERWLDGRDESKTTVNRPGSGPSA